MGESLTSVATPRRARNLAESVFDYVIEQIESAALKPGDKLRVTITGRDTEGYYLLSKISVARLAAHHPAKRRSAPQIGRASSKGYCAGPRGAGAPPRGVSRSD